MVKIQDLNITLESLEKSETWDYGTYKLLSSDIKNFDARKPDGSIDLTIAQRILDTNVNKALMQVKRDLDKNRILSIFLWSNLTHTRFIEALPKVIEGQLSGMITDGNKEIKQGSSYEGSGVAVSSDISGFLTSGDRIYKYTEDVWYNYNLDKYEVEYDAATHSYSLIDTIDATVKTIEATVYLADDQLVGLANRLKNDSLFAALTKGERGAQGAQGVPGADLDISKVKEDQTIDIEQAELIDEDIFAKAADVIAKLTQEKNDRTIEVNNLKSEITTMKASLSTLTAKTNGGFKGNYHKSDIDTIPSSPKSEDFAYYKIADATDTPVLGTAVTFNAAKPWIKLVVVGGAWKVATPLEYLANQPFNNLTAAEVEAEIAKKATDLDNKIIAHESRIVFLESEITNIWDQINIIQSRLNTLEKVQVRTSAGVTLNLESMNGTSKETTLVAESYVDSLEADLEDVKKVSDDNVLEIKKVKELKVINSKDEIVNLDTMISDSGDTADDADARLVTEEYVDGLVTSIKTGGSVVSKEQIKIGTVDAVKDKILSFLELNEGRAYLDINAAAGAARDVMELSTTPSTVNFSPGSSIISALGVSSTFPVNRYVKDGDKVTVHDGSGNPHELTLRFGATGLASMTNNPSNPIHATVRGFFAFVARETIDGVLYLKLDGGKVNFSASTFGPPRDLEYTPYTKVSKAPPGKKERIELTTCGTNGADHYFYGVTKDGVIKNYVNQTLGDGVSEYKLVLEHS